MRGERRYLEDCPACFGPICITFYDGDEEVETRCSTCEKIFLATEVCYATLSEATGGK